MSDDNKWNLSRRQLLGATGTLGAASALGGMATTSLLWDEEKFGNESNPNVLQAGALDLKVDWEEHYIDWIGEETQYDARRVDSAMDVQEGEVAFPRDNPMLAVPAEQANDFFESTIVEQSDLTDQPDPVITLEDVKPGDFGEVTLSYHVFDNPGFVSFCGEVHADVDNGITEAEDKVNGHDPDDSDGTEGGDLGDYVQAQVFYDRNCDNIRQSGEIEVMLVTDVSESMEDLFPGTPDIDGDPNDSQSGGTALEAVKAHVGDNGLGTDLLSNIASCAGDSVEIGSVACADRLNYADNLADGDDSGEGFAAEGPANLDKALGNPNDADYGELKSLYGSGMDFEPDFDTDDPDVDYEAERPYTEDGGSTVPDGLLRAYKGILPEGFVAQSADFEDVEGIDPSGNADLPGDVRKLIVVFTDGRPGEADPGFAEDVSNSAEENSVDILPIIVNDTPSQNDLDFADNLATSGISPQITTNYGELQTAMENLEGLICSQSGGEAESVIAGPGPINEVLGELEDCMLLSPSAVGVGSASEEFGGECHQPSVTNCIALEWWLPYDLPGVNDNIVQSDRLEFQFSFEAVQCRHNTTDDGEPIDTLPDADEENNAQHYAD